MTQEQRRAFGSFIEDVKRSEGRGGADNFTYEELLDLAEKFLEISGEHWFTSRLSHEYSGNLATVVWNAATVRALTQEIGVAPTQSLRRGEKVSKRRIQPVDLGRLDLAKFESDIPTEEISGKLIHSAQVLQQIAPGIAKLDRSECQVDLYVSTTRDEDQGGLFLPSELVTAAAKVGATVQVSILVLLDELDIRNTGTLGATSEQNWLSEHSSLYRTTWNVSQFGTEKV